MASEPITSVQALVAAREARGFSAEDIQRQLKLHPKQVAAIEAGDWAALPGTPFVRGTLRNYAKLVGADVEPLLASIGDQIRPPELRASASLQEPLRSGGMMGFDNGGRGSRWIWALLVVIGLVAFALFFGRDGDVSKVPSWIGSARDGGSDKPAGGTDTETVPIQPSGIPPAPGVPQQPAAPGSDAGSGAGPATSGASAAGGAASVGSGAAGGTASAAAAAGATAAAAVAPTPPPSAAPSAPADGAIARFSFDMDSWVELKGADGKMALFGLQKAGTAAEVTVKLPATLIAGNADKVKLEVDGKSVPLKGAPGSGIGRVNLP